MVEADEQSLVSGEDLVWRLVIPLMIVAQVAALASGWKRSYRFAGGAVAFSPALLTYVAILLSVENGPGGFSATPSQLAFLLTVAVPLIVGVIYLCGARLPAYPLWIAWLINMVPLAFTIFVVCCFKLQF